MVLAFNKISQGLLKGKKKRKLRRQYKQQNQTQIWHVFGGLSDKEFKITMTKVLRTLKEKVYSMQEQMGSVSRNGNSETESRGNARNQRHCNRCEECL